MNRPTNFHRKSSSNAIWKAQILNRNDEHGLVYWVRLSRKDPQNGPAEIAVYNRNGKFQGFYQGPYPGSF